MKNEKLARNKIFCTIAMHLGSIFYCYGQCDDFVRSKYDEFDRVTEYRASFEVTEDDLAKTRLSIQFSHSSNRNYLNIHASVSIDDGSGRSSYKLYDGAYLHFLFEDGSDFKLYKTKNEKRPESYTMHTQIHKNTSETIVEELRNKEMEFKKLKTSPIKAIRLASGHSGKYDFSLTATDKVKFQKIITCLNFL